MATAAELAENRLTPADRAFRARLSTGAITPEDEVAIERARALRVHRTAGKTFDQAAKEMGASTSAKVLANFFRSPRYGMACDYLDRQEVMVLDESGEKALTRARAEVAQLTLEATRYLRECFKRSDAGEPVDDAKMMWATELVAKKSALLEAPATGKPFVQVNIHSLQAAVALTRALEPAIDITPEAK